MLESSHGGNEQIPCFEHPRLAQDERQAVREKQKRPQVHSCVDEVKMGWRTANRRGTGLELLAGLSCLRWPQPDPKKAREGKLQSPGVNFRHSFRVCRMPRKQRLNMSLWEERVRRGFVQWTECHHPCCQRRKYRFLECRNACSQYSLLLLIRGTWVAKLRWTPNNIPPTTLERGRVCLK
jgi:hypothetical protein